MDPAEAVVDACSDLRRATIRGRRAPYKPIVLLWAIGRLWEEQGTGGRLVPFETARDQVVPGRSGWFANDVSDDLTSHATLDRRLTVDPQTRQRPGPIAESRPRTTDDRQPNNDARKVPRLGRLARTEPVAATEVPPSGGGFEPSRHRAAPRQ